MNQPIMPTIRRALIPPAAIPRGFEIQKPHLIPALERRLVRNERPFPQRSPIAMTTFTHADVAEVARMLRTDGSTPSFRHGTATEPLSGEQCVIYALGFPNGDNWAVRIPSHMSHLPDGAISNYVGAEARILKDLEASGFSFAPRLLGYSSAFDNPIGFPYLVLTWIEGKPLEWTSAVPARRDVRDKILRQMADIALELALCTCAEEAGKTVASTFPRELRANYTRGGPVSTAADS